MELLSRSVKTVVVGGGLASAFALPVLQEPPRPMVELCDCCIDL